MSIYNSKNYTFNYVKLLIFFNDFPPVPPVFRVLRVMCMNRVVLFVYACVYVFVSFNIIKIISLVVDPFFRFFFHLNVYVIFLFCSTFCFSYDYEYFSSVFLHYWDLLAIFRPLCHSLIRNCFLQLGCVLVAERNKLFHLAAVGYLTFLSCLRFML